MQCASAQRRALTRGSVWNPEASQDKLGTKRKSRRTHTGLGGSLHQMSLMDQLKYSDEPHEPMDYDGIRERSEAQIRSETSFVAGKKDAADRKWMSAAVQFEDSWWWTWNAFVNSDMNKDLKRTSVPQVSLPPQRPSSTGFAGCSILDSRISSLELIGASGVTTTASSRPSSRPSSSRPSSSHSKANSKVVGNEERANSFRSSPASELEPDCSSARQVSTDSKWRKQSNAPKWVPSTSKLGRVASDLCLVHMHLKNWKRVAEVASLALLGFGDTDYFITTELGESRPDEELWIRLRIRFAVASAQLGDYEGCKRGFREVLKLQPRNRNAKRGLEIMQFLQVQLQDALLDWRQALQDLAMGV